MESKNYICDGTKFIYAKGYIGLPIALEGLPETITVGGQALKRKSTFHVSLLCVKELLLKKAATEQTILDQFCFFTKDHDISFIKFTGEFRHARDSERQTLIALCEVSSLKEFFTALAGHLGIEIPPQLTHVTLYTLQPELGIGLNSAEEMAAKSVLVEPPPAVRAALSDSLIF